MGLLSTIGAASGRSFGLTRVAAAIKDAYFNLTTLLLPGNGTNGAQNNTFLDSSTNNFTITRNGNTTQGTFSPFSQTGWGNYFDNSSGSSSSGTGSYLSTNVAAISSVGSSDFSIECFVYCTKQTNTTAQGIVSYGISGNTAGTSYLSLELSSTGYLNCYYAQTSTATVSDAALFPINQWVHVVVCRSSSIISLYVNGTRKSTASTSATVGSTGNALTIGGQWYDASQASRSLTGYISNARIVKGSSAYDATQSTLTVPTTTLTAVTNTSLLTCQNNRFIDNSSNAYTITAGGTPSVQAFSPFAPTAAYSSSVVGGSGYFDGSGDYLSAASNAAFAFGTGDFTIEFWYYPLAINLTNNPFVDTRNVSGSTSGIFVRVGDGGSLQPTTIYATFGGAAFSAGGLVGYAWNHIAVTRASNTVRVYVNGVSGTSGTSTQNLSDTGLLISKYIDSGNGINGYMSGIRLIKGTAIYSGTSLTIPTAPPTAITNTSLLLNFTNAGITDATAKNDLETVGNAQISTTQSKFGGSSMYFDGTGDRLTTRFVPIQDLSGGNWTIEFWMNLGSSVPTTFRSIAGASNGGGAVPKWSLILNCNTSYTYQANRLQFATYNGGDRQLNVAFTWATNTWYHIAVVNNSGTTTLYIDGVSQGTLAYNIGSGITNGIVVGADGETYSEFTGYIDDFRVTKGYARYTGNFTPPTSAFPLQ